ncbi:Inactive cytochrome P450 76AD1 [Linum grandiflorum]
MSLKLGQITTIVASSPAAAKQILQKHDQSLSDRNAILAVQAQDHHQFGLSVLPVGPTWRNFRKVCNVYLFASQKLDSNQDIRSKKIAELLEGVRQNASQGGKAVDIGKASFRTTFSALSSTLLSLDFEGVAEFMEAARGIVEDSGKPNLGDFFSAPGKMDLQGIQRRMRFP